MNTRLTYRLGTSNLYSLSMKTYDQTTAVDGVTKSLPVTDSSCAVRKSTAALAFWYSL